MTQRAAAMSRTGVPTARRRGLLRLLLIASLLLISVGYVSPAFNYYKISMLIDAEQAEHDALRNRNRELVGELERLDDMGYIEEVARAELGLVKPGEQPFIVKELDREAQQVEVVARDESVSLALREILIFYTAE